MLASVSGVCQLVFSILKLDSYLYYLLPFPLVLSALRSGPSASRKTLYATFFLTLGTFLRNGAFWRKAFSVLLGFPRAVSYLLLYGFLGFTLGTLWHQGSPWWLTWPVCTMSYVAGMFSYIYVASFFLKENLFKLVTYNVHTTLVRFCLVTFLDLSFRRKLQRCVDFKVILQILSRNEAFFDSFASILRHCYGPSVLSCSPR